MYSASFSSFRATPGGRELRAPVATDTPGVNRHQAIACVQSFECLKTGKDARAALRAISARAGADPAARKCDRGRAD